ncbi:UbiA family prenyltransferase [Nocardioides acrostichi]|uniref:UbiA family prenyltransferase n=1 Tax=Nocardioides acrostichi TaxID=2784339 RepID=A0A930Y6Z8_9ACTN|nr:UbiA family prenyltransferase [Nocardioides acrostichi]MBF4161481.1 UbiA family prenyltransferase [Nocardioides acrostichi]
MRVPRLRRRGAAPDPSTEPDVASSDDDTGAVATLTQEREDPPTRTLTSDDAAATESGLDRRTSYAPPPPAGRLGAVRASGPMLLLRAAHPRHAVVAAVSMALVAGLSGRPGADMGLVLVTVLVGQALLGWLNDLVDRGRDARHERPGKPVADGRLDPGTVWFVLCCGVLLLVPLAFSNGRVAGSLYLLGLLVGVLGTVLVRRTILSFVPWAASFALYAGFLSYGTWPGREPGAAPSLGMVVLFALLGIGVHVLTALWGLVDDDSDGYSYLPLRLGRVLGATRLLAVTVAYIAVVLVAMVIVGSAVGLRS